MRHLCPPPPPPAYLHRRLPHSLPPSLPQPWLRQAWLRQAWLRQAWLRQAWEGALDAHPTGTSLPWLPVPFKLILAR
jgi:hypothetical protein